jgi:hypothetical protein
MNQFRNSFSTCEKYDNDCGVPILLPDSRSLEQLIQTVVELPVDHIDPCCPRIPVQSILKDTIGHQIGHS